MRDAITLTRAGHPVVVVVQDPFERAARAQAKGLGVPDLNIYVYPQYATGAITAGVEEEKGARVADEFASLLLNNVGR